MFYMCKTTLTDMKERNETNKRQCNNWHIVSFNLRSYNIVIHWFDYIYMILIGSDSNNMTDDKNINN